MVGGSTEFLSIDSRGGASEGGTFHPSNSDADEHGGPAGRHAAARLAHVEAISHFERDLATLAALPEDPVRDGLEIELQLARGSSLFTAHGFNATDAGNVYARARELAERRGDSHQLFMAVYGLWQSAAGSGKILDCRRLSSRLQQLIADGHNDELLLQAHHSAWTTGRAVGGKAYRRPR